MQIKTKVHWKCTWEFNLRLFGNKYTTYQIILRRFVHNNYNNNKIEEEKKDMGAKNQFLRISLNQIIFNVCVQQKYCCCLSFWRLSSCYFCFFAWELSYPLQLLQCWQLLALWKLWKINFWQIMTWKWLSLIFRVVV